VKFPVFFPVSRQFQWRQVRTRLGPPPSSLRKPPFPESTPNRALLRGFPATYFQDFGLCRRSRFFAMIFGALSLHPKIPFPAAGLKHEVPAVLAPLTPIFWASVTRDSWARQYSGRWKRLASSFNLTASGWVSASVFASCQSNSAIGQGGNGVGARLRNA
jgi:hypothetical protein